MLTYADVCQSTLFTLRRLSLSANRVYADVCGRMLASADVC
jgi:hypothetical protein